MIRTIDTHTMYMQTPRISDDVQVTQQHAGLQQQQFTYLMEQEWQRERETVVEAEQLEFIRTGIGDDNGIKYNQANQYSYGVNSVGVVADELRDRETSFDMRV